jgi:hypothetical protein
MREHYSCFYLADLADRARELAGELMRPQIRTAEERRRLATDCASILSTLAGMMSTNRDSAQSPEEMQGQLSLHERFGPWTERQCAAIRFNALLRAKQLMPRSKRDWFKVPERDIAAASRSAELFQAELRWMDDETAKFEQTKPGQVRDRRR